MTYCCEIYPYYVHTLFLWKCNCSRGCFFVDDIFLISFYCFCRFSCNWVHLAVILVWNGNVVSLKFQGSNWLFAICNLWRVLVLCEWVFCIFYKYCESLKSDSLWIFRVTHWTYYIVGHFKPIKYPLLNNNIIYRDL